MTPPHSFPSLSQQHSDANWMAGVFLVIMCCKGTLKEVTQQRAKGEGNGKNLLEPSG